MRTAVERTNRPEVVGGLGGFAGLFALDTAKYRKPLLASSTDGVGTKIALARQLDRHDTVGIDLVAMVVDDLVACGAEPLFLQDYVACGRVVPERIAAIVTGIATGCTQAGAALVGGETAEHGDLMAPDDYDLAATAVGVVEADAVLGPERVRDGDVVVAMASSGFHSNGYSLVRRVVAAAGLDLTATPAGRGGRWGAAGRGPLGGRGRRRRRGDGLERLPLHRLLAGAPRRRGRRAGPDRPARRAGPPAGRGAARADPHLRAGLPGAGAALRRRGRARLRAHHRRRAGRQHRPRRPRRAGGRAGPRHLGAAGRGLAARGARRAAHGVRAGVQLRRRHGRRRRPGRRRRRGRRPRRARWPRVGRRHRGRADGRGRGVTGGHLPLREGPVLLTNRRRSPPQSLTGSQGC